MVGSHSVATPAPRSPSCYGFKQLLVFRVRAQDTVGNWSGWVNSSPRKIVAYQNSNTNVAYSGTWHRVATTEVVGHGLRLHDDQGQEGPADVHRPQRPLRRAEVARPPARSRSTSTARSRHVQPQAGSTSAWAGSSPARPGPAGAPTRSASSRSTAPEDWPRRLHRPQVAELRSAAPTPPARPAASACPGPSS